MADKEPIRGSPDDIPNVVAWGWDFVMYPGDWGIKCHTSVELTKWEFRPYSEQDMTLRADYEEALEALLTTYEQLTAAKEQIATLEAALANERQRQDEKQASRAKAPEPPTPPNQWLHARWDANRRRVRERLKATGVFESARSVGGKILISPESRDIIQSIYHKYGFTVLAIFNMEVDG